MGKAAPVDQREVAQGWSLSFILLMVVVAVATGCAGYLLKRLFEPPVRRVITKREGLSSKMRHVIAAELTNLGRSSEYKNPAKIQDKVVFVYSLTISNACREVVSNVVIHLRCESSGFDIPDEPLMDYSSALVHESVVAEGPMAIGGFKWRISPLDAGEWVQFSWRVQSASAQGSPRVVSEIRAVGWECLPVDGHAPAGWTTPFNKRIAEMTGWDILVLGVLSGIGAVTAIVCTRLALRCFLVRESPASPASPVGQVSSGAAPSG